MPGPTKKSSAGTTRSLSAVLDHELRVERDQRRRRVGRVHRDAAIGVEDRVLAVDRRRRVGVADVAAGAIARPAGAVVPAARVLRHVAADRALVANLRRGDESAPPRPAAGSAPSPSRRWRSSVSVVIAPISRPPPASLIPRSSLTMPRSTTTFGFLMRSFSQSKVSMPPAMTQASAPWRSSTPSASATLAGWNSSNAGITSRIGRHCRVLLR